MDFFQLCRMGSTTIQGESHLTDSYNNIEYANDQYDDYELQVS